MKVNNIFLLLIILLIITIPACKKNDTTTGIAPVILSTNPINNAENTAIDSEISAKFSELPDTTSLTTNNFILMTGTKTIPGVVSYKDSTFSFVPLNKLDTSTIYTATISKEVKSISGTNMKSDYIWNFTTGNVSDITSPEIILSSPENNTKDVSINKSIVVTFSEPMDASTINNYTFILNQGATIITGVISYSETSATFNPINNLDFNKIYTITITNEVKDIAGNTMINNFTTSFTTAAVLDITSPTVNTIDPNDNASGVSLNKVIYATFNEEIEMSSLNNYTFFLKQGTNLIKGVLSYSGTTATFVPANNLENSKVYTITITTGIKDISGNSMENNYTSSFTTTGILDITPPVVNSTDPLNNASNIALNKVISATFSEAIDPTTINNYTLFLKQGTTTISGTARSEKESATFVPSTNLEYNKTYTLTITTGVKDLAGNSLATDYKTDFTTSSDKNSPILMSIDPVDNSSSVPLNKAISVTFNKAMNTSTINNSTFTLTQGTSSVSGAVSCSGETATFVPGSLLESNKSYTLTITTGVTDLTGNALASNFTAGFTTVESPDITLPVVKSTSPIDNEINVARNRDILVTFSEEMNPSTINSSTFSLKQGTTSVSGTIAYSGITAKFTSANTLTAGVVYTATMTTGAKDLAGNALAVNTVFNLKTSGTNSTLSVINLGTAGNYVILAKTAITNIPTSAITGDLGLSPAATSYITGLALTDATGYATASQVTGKVYAADMVSPTSINLTTAVNNMITAYNDAAGRPFPDFFELYTGNISGKTLTPGLYKWTNSVTIQSNLTISGGPNDIFIFQIAGNLTVASAVKINLIGGILAKNIFWQVADQVTIGTMAHFEGIILAQTGIIFQTGASINGRALAQTAVVLDANIVKGP